MPRFNRTGPMGQGPMTGRGMGPCAGGMREGFGRGADFRRRFGRGFCGFGSFRAVGFTKEEEKKMLEDEIKNIEEYLKELKTQLE